MLITRIALILLQTISDPLKEGHHFEQNLGGIAGLFENMRSNTQVCSLLKSSTRHPLTKIQGIANSHLEAEKQLKGTVLPILERLHAEIKNKSKELNKGAAKGSKEVDKARNLTQKHIELLGQHTAAFASSGGKIEPANDPYILQRGVNHRLNKQVLEENNNRHDLLAVQDSFQQFEAHVIQTIQQALGSFLQCLGGQEERQKSMYSDMVGASQRIPLDFEFKGFVSRNSGTLVDRSIPQRSVSNISFPNQGHASTKPLIAGSLERKSRMALKGYDTGYYVVTPSKYLHEFKDDDDYKSDPTPELSLYLPDCTIGGTNGEKFNVKGKDTSKGKVGGALAMSHELAFKAHTASDAEKWWSVIREAAGAGNVSGSLPVSPVDSRSASGQQVPPQYQDIKQPAPIQTQQQSTGYQAAPVPMGAGIVPGSAGGISPQGITPQGAGPVPGSAGGVSHQGATPISEGAAPSSAGGLGSAPTSGVDRAPGQY